MSTIKGIQIGLSGEEIKTHLKEQADYHNKKVQYYNDKLELIKDEVQSSGNNSTDFSNTMTSFESRIKTHQYKRQAFNFLADHIDTTNVYNLDKDDLTELEFIRDYHGW
jgi:hypothetical protein